uniref:Uncharacterized protein n=1 Tax=Strigamia maritima TaxID=126957 RepID=T1IQC6_STRMM
MLLNSDMMMKYMGLNTGYLNVRCTNFAILLYAYRLKLIRRISDCCDVMIFNTFNLNFANVLVSLPTISRVFLCGALFFHLYLKSLLHVFLRP